MVTIIWPQQRMESGAIYILMAHQGDVRRSSYDDEAEHL